MDTTSKPTPLVRSSPAKVSHRTVLLVSLPLLFELVFAATLFFQLNQAQAEIAAEQHAKDVIYQATRLNNSIFDAAFAMAGYSMTKRSLFYERYSLVAESIPIQIASIAESVKQDPSASAIAHKLVGDWARTTAAVRDAKEMIEDNQGLSMSQVSLYAELKATTSELKHDTAAITDSYVAIAKAAPKAKEQSRSAITVSIIVGVIGSFALTIWLALSFDRDLRIRLRRLIENTARLAQRQQLGPPLTGPDDEIAVLDRDFRRMASELEEASQKERDIVDFASDVICSISEDGLITRINPACVNMWDFAPEDLVGTNYLSLIQPEQHQQLSQKFLESREQSIITTAEAAIRTKSGRESYVNWSIRWSPIRSTFYCVIHDITDRKSIEAMKQQFLAMVSHDLRSPLMSLRGTLELLKLGAFGELSETAVDRLGKAQNTASWLMDMVNDLLEVERLEGGLELQRKITDVAELIGLSIEQVQTLAETRNIEFVIDPLEARTLFCDPDRVKQVLVNLMSNAVKFSPDGSRILVGSFLNGDAVEIRVKDFGRGIPTDKQELIFERFKQVSKSDGSGERKGFGLGLPICKMIVEAHGGEMGVQSSVGQGSTFWFRLPVTEVAATMPTVAVR